MPTTNKKANLIVNIPIKAWSPSSLRDYESCPRKTQYSRVQKLCIKCFEGSMSKGKGSESKCSKCGAEAPPEAEPLRRGTEIHDAAQMFIRGQLKKLPVELSKPGVKKYLNKLAVGYKARTVRTELELAFDKSWKLVQWMDSSVYVRFKVDVLELPKGQPSLVTDWKTGNPKPEEYDDQLNGYAVAALSAGFGEEVRSRLYYTDHDKLVTTEAGTLKLVQLGKVQKYWDSRAKKLLVDRHFVPKPSRKCLYCDYSANKGGPCEY